MPEGNCSVDYRGHSNRGDRERKRTEPQVYSIQTQPDEIHSSTRSEKHTKASTSLARGRAGTPGTKQAGQLPPLPCEQHVKRAAQPLRIAARTAARRSSSRPAAFHSCVSLAAAPNSGAASAGLLPMAEATLGLGPRRRAARPSPYP